MAEPTAEGAPEAAEMSVAALLRLLQLASPGLPVGGFAYSQGLEPAVHAGWVHDEATAGDWMCGLLEHGLRSLEVPLFRRLCAAWSAARADEVATWNDFLYASRASRELQSEDRRLGAALARVLTTLGVEGAARWSDHRRVTQVNMFALACARLADPRPPRGRRAAVHLGGEPGRRRHPSDFARAERWPAHPLPARPADPGPGGGRVALADEDIGQGAPGLAIASALHETQYSRIFRS